MERLLKTSSFFSVQDNRDTRVLVYFVLVGNKTNYLSFRRENYARTNYVLNVWYAQFITS